MHSTSALIQSDALSHVFVSRLCHSWQTHRFSCCSVAAVGAFEYPKTNSKKGNKVKLLLRGKKWSVMTQSQRHGFEPWLGQTGAHRPSALVIFKPGVLVAVLIKTSQWDEIVCRDPVVNTYTARPVCWSGWISDSYCSLKPLCSGMGEVVPARTSPTLLPPSPRTVLLLSCFKVSQCINCRGWHSKS